MYMYSFRQPQGLAPNIKCVAHLGLTPTIKYAAPLVYNKYKDDPSFEGASIQLIC